MIDVILHLDVHLLTWVKDYGIWIYAILFAIIFSETGFVVTPILPGDSLLFVAGAIAAGGELNLWALLWLLCLAAILGNTANYAIGRWLGKHFFKDGNSRWLRHGGKAVVISRFLPIVRTYVPFVAGMAAMAPREFTMYNAAGAVLWVGSITVAGYFFGNIPWIRGNLTAIIVGIVVVSLLPLVFAFVKARRASKATGT